MEQIAKAFIKAQSEMSNAVKDSSNPFFKSKYADLNSIREAVLPALHKNQIAVLQPTVNIDGKNYVKTVLLHESGETIESLTEILFAKANDAQAQGSGISYARRYGLQSLVCIGADDDDANVAVAPKQHKEKPTLVKMDGKDMTSAWQNVITGITTRKTIASIDDIKKHYILTPEVEQELTSLLKPQNN